MDTSRLPNLRFGIFVFMIIYFKMMKQRYAGQQTECNEKQTSIYENQTQQFNSIVLLK